MYLSPPNIPLPSLYTSPLLIYLSPPYISPYILLVSPHFSPDTYFIRPNVMTHCEIWTPSLFLRTGLGEETEKGNGLTESLVKNQDILIHVFRYLSQSDLVNCSLVSKV